MEILLSVASSVGLAADDPLGPESLKLLAVGAGHRSGADRAGHRDRYPWSGGHERHRP